MHNHAKFSVTEDLIHRFVSSLLSKRFLILTGLSGSGKTKLAQFLAMWLTPHSIRQTHIFTPGAKIKSDRIEYVVHSADRLAVEFWNSVDEETTTKVVLPLALIEEWAEAIESNRFTREASARSIREIVGKTTSYSTQLNSFETHLKAAGFALVESGRSSRVYSCYEVVAVGPDWTSNEYVLGYADALNTNRYARTQALDLLLRAIDRPELPHFLILDEMNLSHVERYFADVLSGIESNEPISLHNDKDELGNLVPRDGVPPKVLFPPNLYVIGTVNIDETTYMFSPKVLDRANVIEFRVGREQLMTFLSNPVDIDLSSIAGQGRRFAEAFVNEARGQVILEELDQLRLTSELTLFFDVLADFGAEFAFRSAREIARFLGFHKKISPSSNTCANHAALSASLGG